MSPLAKYIKPREWHANRRLGIGGSDATILSDGDADRIYELWLLKTGRKEPEDLLGQPILFGVVTEELNRQFLSNAIGREVWGDGEERTHPDFPWIRASLDGITTSSDGRECYVECKCVNGWRKESDLIKKYNPQLLHCMAAGGWEVSILSVFIGNMKHFHTEIEFDAWKWIDLLDIEQAFWSCVIQDKEPTLDATKGLSA